MQLLWNLSLSGEDYVTTQAWRKAELDCCPEHPGGGCGFVRNGTYRRKTRWGDARIPRWYCPDAHKTWSLLPRCFSAQLPGTLDELEAAALAAETEPSLRAAAECARPGHVITEAANRRWLKHRRDLVASCLTTVITLLPDLFVGCTPSVRSLRAHLGVGRLLFELRGHAAAHLQHLASPLGFAVRINPVPISDRVNQHMMGPDPPS